MDKIGLDGDLVRKARRFSDRNPDKVADVAQALRDYETAVILSNGPVLDRAFVWRPKVKPRKQRLKRLVK